MKEKFKNLLFFLVCLLIFEDVSALKATLNVNNSASAVPKKCPTFNCMSLGTAGMRITLLDKNGKKVAEPIDLWYYNNSLGAFVFGESSYVRFTKKHVRQDFQKNDEYIDKDLVKEKKESAYKDFYSIEDVFPGILSIDGMTNEYNNGYVNSSGDSPKNTRTPNTTATLMQSIYNNINSIYINKTASASTPDYLANLLKEMNTNLTVNNITNYYLQFEPLVSWGNTHLDTRYNDNANYVFMGTVSELVYYYHLNDNNKIPANISSCKFNSGQTHYLDEKWRALCYTDNKNGNKYLTGNPAASNYKYPVTELDNYKGYHNYDNNYSAFNGCNISEVSGCDSSFSVIAGMGIYSKNNKNDANTGYDIIPNKIFKAVTDNYSNGVIPAGAGLKFENAYGVAFISLENVGSGICNDQARAAIKVAEASKKSHVDIIKNNQDEYKLVIDDCFTDGELSISKCPLLDPDFINNVGVIDESINICEPQECSVILANTPNVLTSKFDPNSAYIDDPESRTLYDKAIAFLFNNHEKYFKNDNITSKERLNYFVYKGIYNKAASCESIPNCNPPKTNALCSDSNYFTFSDNNNSDCLKEGIAYNNKTDEGYIGGNLLIQSSTDAEYGTQSDPGYCEEMVSFEFPKDAVGNPIKAGTLFKWGANDDKLSDAFGTMTVKRKCYISESVKEDPTEGSRIFTTKWVDVIGKNTYTSSGSEYYPGTNGKINPKITLHYKEAMPKGYETNASVVEKDLNVYLKSVTMKAYNSDGTELNDNNITYYKSDGTMITEVSEDTTDLTPAAIETYKTQDPRQFTCYASGKGPYRCNQISYFDMTATYQITYDDTLKWYAKKSDYGKYTTSDDENIYEDFSSNKISSEYVLLGYGLPTSFITPTNLQESKDKSYGYSLQSDSSKGILYVTIKNIGTESKLGYHFDDLIKFNLTDDATSEAGSREDDFKDKVVYSCGFSIYNKLFGYEDGLCTEDCDTDEPPEGLDVVFRTVELIDNEDDIKKAFPGLVGNGRERGSNWNLDNDKLINILSRDVYSAQPLYHINLTPEKISNIRNSNKEIRAKGFDPYTYMKDNTYSFYQSDIYKLNNVYVTSEFLTSLKGKNWLDGTCLNHFGNNTYERSKYFATMSPGECSWQEE